MRRRELNQRLSQRRPSREELPAFDVCAGRVACVTCNPLCKRIGKVPEGQGVLTRASLTSVRVAGSLRFMLDVGQEHVDRAFSIARWYGRRAHRAELSDLESAALEGLAKAARDWDPEAPALRRRKDGRPSFWNFAFKRILGEMRDELRRFDHLTRKQRAMVAEDGSGNLLLREEGLEWINPEEPVSLRSEE